MLPNDVLLIEKIKSKTFVKKILIVYIKTRLALFDPRDEATLNTELFTLYMLYIILKRKFKFLSRICLLFHLLK